MKIELRKKHPDYLRKLRKESSAEKTAADQAKELREAAATLKKSVHDLDMSDIGWAK